MKSKLGKLRQKLENSGINDNPIITDLELQELRERMQELIDFMADSNNRTMEWAFLLELQGINRVIENRESD